MATLIVEQDSRRKGTVINGRIVIGRRPQSHIPISDRTVSRIHAWIGSEFDRHFISDSTSRSGTLINGERLRGRQTLRDGDVIQIASVTMLYHNDDMLPSDVEVLDFTDHKLQGDDGIFFNCDCGAPIWSPWETAGKRGRCRDCGRLLQLPNPPEAKLHADPSQDTHVEGVPVVAQRRTAGSIRIDKPLLAPARRASRELDDSYDLDAHSRGPRETAGKKPETACGACQTTISFLDEKTTCPECGVSFHAECWRENGGCSSYGCSQVGVLDRQLIEAAEKAKARVEARRKSTSPSLPTSTAAPPLATEKFEEPPVERAAAEVHSAPEPAPIEKAPLLPIEKAPSLDPIVSALSPSGARKRVSKAEIDSQLEDEAALIADSRRVEWAYALLPAAVLCGMLGLFLFGVPSLLLAVGVVVRGLRKPIKNRRFSDAVILVSILLAAGGGAFST